MPSARNKNSTNYQCLFFSNRTQGRNNYARQQCLFVNSDRSSEPRLSCLLTTIYALQQGRELVLTTVVKLKASQADIFSLAMDVLHVCIVFYKLYTFNCDYLHANVLISLSIYIDIIKCTYNSIKKISNIWLKYIFKYIYSSDKPVLLDDVAAAYMYEKDC